MLTKKDTDGLEMRWGNAEGIVTMTEKIGNRTMRHAFNLREGINPLARNMPGRIIGEPPLKEGNVKDVTIDYKTLCKEFLQFIGWDTETTVPRKESLGKLEMNFLAKDMSGVNVQRV